MKRQFASLYSEKSRSNFTLIELLVVIAIIAILAAILLPALNSARNRGHAATCINNMKQIAFAFSTYLNDFEDTFPALDYDGANVFPWVAAIYPYVAGEALPFATGVNYHIPNPQSQPFLCPRVSPKEKSATLVSYGYNSRSLGGSKYATVSDWIGESKYPVKVGQLSSPSAQLVIAETWEFSGQSGRRDVGHYNLSGQSKFAFRHNRLANVIFADYHVSAEDSEYLYGSDSRYLPLNFSQQCKGLTARSHTDWGIAYGYYPFD